jgi:hypothetical protein
VTDASITIGTATQNSPRNHLKVCKLSCSSYVVLYDPYLLYIPIYIAGYAFMTHFLRIRRLFPSSPTGVLRRCVRYISSDFFSDTYQYKTTRYMATFGTSKANTG